MKTVGIYIFIFSFFSKSFAQSDTTLVSVNINDIYDLNLKNGTCVIDFYQNTNSNSDSLPKIELMNGSVSETYLANDFKKTKETRIKALLRNNFSFKNYPFDKQVIQIILEPTKESEFLHFKTDSSLNIISSENTHLTGWKIDSVSFNNVRVHYDLLRNNVKKKYNYDRVIFNIVISRLHAFDYLLKSIFHNIIAVLLVCLALFHSCDQISYKYSLSVGSIFVLFSNFSQQLYLDSGFFTIIDKINLKTLFFVGYAIVVFTICYYIFFKSVITKKLDDNKDYIILKRKKIKKIEKWLLFTGVSIYILSILMNIII